MRRITEFILLLAALNGFPFPTPAAPEPRGLIHSARVPFIANEGQLASPEVKYYAKTFGGTVYALADGKIVYVLPKYESGKKAGAAVITEILRGAFQARPSGAGQSKARVNSFTGGRPENWKTNLPVFDRLDFGEVYDGINLLLSARGNNVEKIFVVSPGADPDEIILGFEGTSGMQIAPDGRLELPTALGKVCFTAPVAWQTDAPAAPAGGLAEEILNASDRTRPDFTPVEVAYALRGDGAVGFRLGSYDRSRPLVIDPFLASTFIGGGGADAVQAIVVDSQTNVYAAGWTDSVDFPVTNNTPFASLTNGDCDVFISKFDASLGVLSVSTYLGGSSNDQAFAVGLDADEQKIWLAGYTESEDFPFAANGYQTNYNGEGDAFAAVLSSSDLELEQATYLGGTNLDSATAIAMDNGSCQQYIVGYTESEDFPVAANGYQTNYNGARDAFAVVFSNTVGAADFKGGTFLGGTSADQAAAVAASSGDGVTNFIYVAGSTESGDFPVTNGYQKTHAGGADVFVAQLDAWLTNRSAATFLGGTADDEASAVALDVSNRLYVAGYTKSSGFPTSAGAYQSALAGGADAFVSCLTNSVSNLCASTYIGGSGDDAARCLVLDSSASTSLVYLAGYTESDNFPATRSAYNRSRNGAQDAFILRMNGALANLQAATYMGGAANDQALALALSPETNLLFTAGITASEDFPASDVAYETAFRGGASDGFVSRFPVSLSYGTLKWRKFLAGVCSSPALTWDGTIAVGGSSSTGLVGFSSAGVERWRVTTTSTVAIEVAPLDGLGAPVIGTNNVIYINTSSGKAYAVQPGGATTLLFEFERAEGAPSFWTSPALDNHGRCFFSYNEYFYALELSGSLLWTKDLVYSCNALPSVGSNDMVYAAASLGPILKEFVAEDGSISKEWSATSGSIYSSPALDSNGTIYAASGNKLYAFNAGGTVQTWTAGGQIYSSPAIGTNGVIYVGGGNNLYAFNTNGATVKTWHAGKPVNSSPAIAADGSIIVGAANPTPSEAGQVYSFNPDGTTNWVFDTVTDIQFHSPMIDSEGTVYISDRGYLYALYGSAPPAESAWPMFRRDALRTGNQGLNIQNFLRPTGVAASKYGTFSNYVHVSWNGVANAVNYELWRGTNDSPALAGRIYRLTGTNYNDTAIEGGRVYYYWVKARTPVAMSALSDPDSGGIPPFPPENVAATKGIPTNSVVVTWQASSNATLYYVYRSLTNATNTAAQIGTTSATNYNDETLTPGLTNWYWVKAGNDVAGISGFGENDYGGIPCRAPTGLSAGQGAYIRRTDLNWNSSAGASSYLVYRSAENNSSTAGILNETNGLSARDYSGTPLRRYYYWVRTTNEFGLSSFSSPAVGWSLLAAPQKVSASAGAYPNMIRVSWVIGSTDATDHVIFRSLSSDPSTAEWQSDVVYNDPAATNYDDTAIIRGPDYYYWVAAKNNYGSSAWTAAGSPGGTIPSTPTDLSASDGAYSNMVKITWNNAAGATSYRVYRDENYAASDPALIGAASVNYYNDTSASHGVVYYYWVKAGNNHGFSSFSAFNSGWRGMVPPENVSASDGVSTSAVNVTWSAAPSALKYEVWRGTNGSSASAKRLVNNIAVNSYADTLANPGTPYYYWVKSKRGNYVSALSLSDRGYRAIGMIDLALSDLIFTPAVIGHGAHPAAVSFKVSNLSSLAMNDPNNTVRYDLYLSENPVFDENSVIPLGGSETTLLLSAGAAARVVLPLSVRQAIAIPTGLSGAYYVFIFANHCLPSGWIDPNLANNEASRTGGSISIGNTTALQPVWNDYDGDALSDLALYHEASGTWKIWRSVYGYALTTVSGLGGTGYRPAPRDYDADGKFDYVVYRESSGTWRVRLSAYDYQTIEIANWGGTGWQAVPADYDGDGLADAAVYNALAGGWRAWLSASGYAEINAAGMGGQNWRPVPADYDGDGKADPAVYHETSGAWRAWLSGCAYQEAYKSNWGGTDQRPVPADYDSDGKADPAVYHETSGAWRAWLSSYSYNEVTAGGWGGEGQTAASGDYDGDGWADPAVYWESMGVWRFWLSGYGYSELYYLVPGGVDFKAITAE